MRHQYRDRLENLRTYIANGNFVPGDRLPAERELTKVLGIKRTMLRLALETLERQGVIWRRVGKGTFLPESPEDIPINWLDETSQQLTPIKMMRARLSIEPAIASGAAINASSESMVRIMWPLKVPRMLWTGQAMRNLTTHFTGRLLRRRIPRFW